MLADTRLEDKVYLKLDKKPPERQTNIELLGITMADAGTEFGPNSSYGRFVFKEFHSTFNSLAYLLISFTANVFDIVISKQNAAKRLAML